MVDHDHIHPVGAGDLDLTLGRDPAIDRHDQGHALLLRFMDRGFAHAVAVALALRKKGCVLAAEFFKRSGQHRNAGDPVDIIIAVNGDGFMILDRKLNARDCLAHAGHLKWIGVEVRFGV